MAAVNDIIKGTILTEQGGRAMSNTLYWQIDDLGNDPGMGTAALDILDAYTDTIKVFCSDEWASTCIILENLTSGLGRTVVQQTTPGTGVGFAHGPDQVARFNQYAGQADFLKVHRGSFNQSGILNSLSTRGRWNNDTNFSGLNTWLSTISVMSPNWTIQPFLRWTLLVGPPKVLTQTPIIHVDWSGRVFKLTSRKTRLCRVS